VVRQHDPKLYVIVRDDDSVLEKTGKVTARVLLGVATVGLSELGVENAKDDERRAQERADFERWWAQASPNERAAYQERMRAILPIFQLYQQNQAGWDAFEQQRLLQQQQRRTLQDLELRQSMTPLPRMPLNCTSDRIGKQTFTTCY
jgi:hypothetical protein